MRKLSRILAIVAAIAIPAAVFAISAPDFLPSASKWASANCKNVSKLPFDTNVVCYLFLHSQEQDAKLSTLSPNKQLTAYDSSAHRLGILVESFALAHPGATRAEFFDTDKSLIVGVESDGSIGERLQEIDYTTNDCTGSPYLQTTSIDTYYDLSGKLLRYPEGQYYSMVPNLAPTTIHLSSRTSAGHSGCAVISADWPAIHLQVVTPYTFKVVLPLVYKYE